MYTGTYLRKNKSSAWFWNSNCCYVRTYQLIWILYILNTYVEKIEYKIKPNNLFIPFQHRWCHFCFNWIFQHIISVSIKFVNVAFLFQLHFPDFLSFQYLYLQKRSHKSMFVWSSEGFIYIYTYVCSTKESFHQREEILATYIQIFFLIS